MEAKIENLYIVGYGLSGGFGGARDFEVIEAENLEEAGQYAYEKACECYENYEGRNGLRSIQDVMTQEGIEDEEDAFEIYNEEREDWLDYSAVKYSKEEEKKVMYKHYSNEYKHITG